MVAIFYEHLPTFCYKCGLVGYSEGGCSFGLGDLVSRELDSDLGGYDQTMGQHAMQLDTSIGVNGDVVTD